MKKTISLAIACSLFLASVMPGFAGAATLDENLKTIQDLTAKIKALQDQILGLKTQQQQLATSSNAAALEILDTLKQGSEGDQVKILQTLLALDTAVYPEGMITGYYGPATRRAIERLQRKNGLEAVGFAGPRTRSLLNKMLKEQFKVVEDLEDELEDDVLEQVQAAIASVTLPALPSDPCAIPGIPTQSGPIIQRDGKVKIIQTGNVFIYKDGKHQIVITPNSYHEKDGKKQLLITPGMRIEKDGKFKSIVPCNGSATTTPPVGSDTTAPVITSIVATPSQTSANITWQTNEQATGKVYYGTTNPFTLTGAQSVSETNWWFNNLNTNHAVSIPSLSASTTYYFVIESKDKKGNTATSSVQSFKTSSTPDVLAPVITAVSVTNIGTTTATVTWTTNEAATSKVSFGTTTPLNTATALSVTDGGLVTAHTMQLTNLVPGSTYYFKLESKDAAQNAGQSSETSFVTAALPVDASAPTITAVAATPSTTTAQIAWTTNEAATSKVYYATTTPLSLATALTVTDSALLTNHSMALTGLTASTTYYYLVESKDAANNTGTSAESSFVTN